MKADFDIASSEYDSLFTFSNIGQAQRNRVFKYINPILKQEKKLSILELNCGTGIDAITLGNLSHKVVATDISEGMIQTAKAKKHPYNVSFQVQDINTLKATTFSKKFDLIFSNFGGLNCLSNVELQAFLKTSTGLLKPNGTLILVIMPKHCLWEQLYFSIKGNFRKARRRHTNKYQLVNVGNISVKTWYYNPQEIISLTKKLFTPIKVKPIGIAIPPSYLENSFLTKKPFFSALKVLEELLGQSFWAKYADHFLIELVKK